MKHYTLPHRSLSPPPPRLAATDPIVYTAHTVCQQVVMFISDEHQLAAF